MNKNDSIEIDKILKDLPDSLTSIIKESLDSANSIKKLAARNNLVRMGKTIIPQLHILLESENVLLRMEVAKIVELIADRRSIPFLINLLDDIEFEIRWIAAEGLIKIGRLSIRPLSVVRLSNRAPSKTPIPPWVPNQILPWWSTRRQFTSSSGRPLERLKCSKVYPS